MTGGDVVFFFFQAEDGIRDYKVTGVQTCALPICHCASAARREPSSPASARSNRASNALIQVSAPGDAGSRGLLMSPRLRSCTGRGDRKRGGEGKRGEFGGGRIIKKKKNK